MDNLIGDRIQLIIDNKFGGNTRSFEQFFGIGFDVARKWLKTTENEDTLIIPKMVYDMLMEDRKILNENNKALLVALHKGQQMEKKLYLCSAKISTIVDKRNIPL